MLVIIGPAADDDLRQALLALQAHEEILEHQHVDEQPALTVRLDLAPVLAAGRADRRLDDAEILSAAGIRRDDQVITVMLDAVFVARLARRDQHRLGLDRARHRSAGFPKFGGRRSGGAGNAGWTSRRHARKSRYRAPHTPARRLRPGCRGGGDKRGAAGDFHPGGYRTAIGRPRSRSAGPPCPARCRPASRR